MLEVLWDMCCKYFITVYDSPFGFLNDIVWSAKILNFDKVWFINSFFYVSYYGPRKLYFHPGYKDFFSLLYYMFYSFRFYIEFYDLFWVHFVYGVSKSWYLYLYGYLVDPAPFVEMTFLSSLNCLDIFVRSPSAISV